MLILSEVNSVVLENLETYYDQIFVKNSEKLTINSQNETDLRHYQINLIIIITSTVSDSSRKIFRQKSD